MTLRCEINGETLQDCINFSLGLFSPLSGFMNSSDYHSVVENMCLANGDVWTIPLTLDVDHDTFIRAADCDQLVLVYGGNAIGVIDIEDYFQVDIVGDVIKVFKTDSKDHPGVMKESTRHKYRISGRVQITDESLLEGALDPSQTKAYFISKGWKTVAGFQTRNPIHKAHEYLLRVALEQCDGLFINPLVGWKKVGDFSEEAVVHGYQSMLKEYFVNLNIHFQTLRTPMRYAGPREAIFHAIIRRNLGCTHFIIGRDHAGVGNYYGQYEAHELAKRIREKHDLGIELLLLSEPFYCHKCGQIVSDKTCGHSDVYGEKISGSKIRSTLVENKRPSELLMRKEVADAIIKLGEHKFIKE